MKQAFERSESDRPAISGVVAKCRELVAAHAAAEQKIAKAREVIEAEERRKVQIYSSIQDCLAAARVLDFDLGKALGEEGEEVLPPERSVRAARNTGPSIRELVLGMVREAAPAPLRASEIRERIEELRGPIHEKTVGMTLYRLSQDGLVCRDGWDWKYDDKTKNAGEVHSPAL